MTMQLLIQIVINLQKKLKPTCLKFFIYGNVFAFYVVKGFET